MALPMSVKYPAKVFFFAQNPGDLIDAGYDSIRVQKRKTRSDAWEEVARSTQYLSDEQWNYHFVADDAVRDNEFRAVLQNSADPGTPADVPQPVVRAVDTSYEAIITVQEFRDIYLWGQDSAFIAENGAQQPEYAYVHNIRYGMSKVEKALGVRLLPKKFVELEDYSREHFSRSEWLTIFLNEFPVIDVESLKLKLPGGEDFEYPASWLRVEKDSGALYVVPSAVTLLHQTPLLHRHKFIPGGLEVTYYAGFMPETYMTHENASLKEVVGKEASMGPLNVGGDLVGGAGLAGSSLSLDGLSQSITTTNSSTNAGFGARLIQYEKELKETYKKLLPYYRGLRIRVA